MFFKVVIPLWLNKFFWFSGIDISHRRVGQGTTFSWRQSQSKDFMSKRQKKIQLRKQPERMINANQTDLYQETAPHGQDPNNTKVTNSYSDRHYGSWK